MTANSISLAEKVTIPPKRLTQAGLLSAMEKIANRIEDVDLRKSLADSKGIGTPATRAMTIKEIIKSGYVLDKKGLYITPLGKAYIENMSGINIISPVFAALIDMKVKRVQWGEIAYNKAYQELLEDLQKMCKQAENVKVSGVVNEEFEFDLKCPFCGNGVRENAVGVFCDCGMKIFRVISKKELTDRQIEKLLVNRQLPKMRGFTNKAGKKFSAGLVLNSNKSIEFVFTGRRSV